VQGYVVVALAFLAGLIVFVMQNTATVSIKFIGWHSSPVSLALVVLIAACVGALVTFLADSIRHLGTMKKLQEQTVKARKAEAQLAKIKAEKEKQTKTSDEAMK
jgi:uncharacterized integral membrane protein